MRVFQNNAHALKVSGEQRYTLIMLLGSFALIYALARFI